MKIGPLKWTVVLTLAASAARPQAPPPAAKPLVFDVSLDVVAVDVAVVDARGRPALGLQPGDFALKVDGRPRRVVSAEYVGQDETPPSPEAPPPPAHFSSNEAARTGRLVLIAVDTGSIPLGGGRAVIRSADRLVDALTADDRLGFITLPGPGPAVDFSADHALVRAALQSVVGRAPRTILRLPLAEAIAFERGERFRWESFLELQCGGSERPQQREGCVRQLEADARQVVADWRQRTRGSVESLKQLLRNLRGVEGRKALALVSGGLGADAAEVRELADLAAEAEATLFIVLAEESGVDASRAGRVANDSREVGQGSVQDLASSSRGAVFRAPAGAEGVFERIAGELRGYYLLGFEPEPGDRDGKSHRIEVDVARPRVTVRARTVLRIPTAAPTAEAAIAGLLRSPFLEKGLKLRVSTFALPDALGKVRILVAGDAAGAKRPLRLGMALVAADGRTEQAVGYAGVDHALGDRSAFVGELVCAAAPYTLRVAVVDAAGRRGSVHRELKAALAGGGGLEVSDLVLAAVVPGEPALPAVDTEIDAGALAAKLDLRSIDAAVLGSASVTLEIADTADGPALVSAPAALGVLSGTLREAQGALAAGLLPPGPYVARALVSRGASPVTSVTRPFRILPPRAGSMKAAAGGGLALPAPVFDRTELTRKEALVALLDQALAPADGPVPPGVAQAALLARQGTPEKMLDALKEARGDARVSFLRGIALYAAGEFPGAITQLQEALRLRADLFAAAVFLGGCYAATSRDEDAIGAWNTALIAEGSGPAVFGVLADALLRTGEAGQAVDVLKEGLSAAPNEAGLRRRLGLAHAAAGRREEALPLLYAWLDAHPEDQATTFVALRLLFQGVAAGVSGPAAAADRERLARYARAYVDGKGEERAMVAKWLAYLQQR